MPEVYQSQEDRDTHSRAKGSGSNTDWAEYIRKGVSSFNIVWREKKKIANVTGTLSLLFAVYLFLAPGTYVSTTTILPDVQGLENLQRRGLLGDLAAAAGLTMGLSPSQLYPEVIKSERLLSTVLGMRFHLKEGEAARTPAEIWGFVSEDSLKQYEYTLKKLRNSLDISFDRRTLIVTLQVGTESPIFSAELANTIDSTLDKLTLQFSKNLAGQKVRWIESRLSEIQTELARSEESLKQFRERNRSVANSPELLMQQTRLVREVEINSTVFVELKKQLEIARVEEARTSSLVNILDIARPAYSKSGLPKRYVLAFFVLMALALNVTYILVIDWVRSNPGLMMELKRFKVKSFRVWRKDLPQEH